MILLLNPEKSLIYLSKTKLLKYLPKLINKILKILKIFDFKSHILIIHLLLYHHFISLL